LEEEIEEEEEEMSKDVYNELAAELSEYSIEELVDEYITLKVNMCLSSFFLLHIRLSKLCSALQSVYLFVRSVRLKTKFVLYYSFNRKTMIS
jgi:hypothetical protein